LDVKFQEQIAMAIKQATDLEQSTLMEVNVPGYVFQGLTAYEYLEVQEIIKWQHKSPSVLANLSGKILTPIQKMGEALIPDGFLKKLIPLVERATKNWHQEWEDLKRKAKIDDLDQLKQIPLEQCNHLADSVKTRSIVFATIEGGAGALLGMAGGMIEVDLFLRVSIQTIHYTGLCYGYAPKTRLEQQFAWAILEVATAFTTEERQEAFSRLQNLRQVLYQQAIENLIEDQVRLKFQDVTVETFLTQVLPKIIKLEGTDLLPVIGVAMEIIEVRDMIEKVSTAARREFQLRWLLENRQIRSSV
jgi:hypothetical protein